MHYDVQRRTKKRTFFKEIDEIIDWRKVSTLMNTKMKRGKQDAYGRLAYAPIILFKMLLQTCYGLSDEGVEDMVNDSFSANEFCGLKVEDSVTDHSTLSRFRSELAELNLMDKLLNIINKQLKKKGVILEEGSAIVDATITESPFINQTPTYMRPLQKAFFLKKEAFEKYMREYADVSIYFCNSLYIMEDREKLSTSEGSHPTSDLSTPQRVSNPGSDPEGKWIKKSKSFFGL